jgi:hypothetical protein
VEFVTKTIFSKGFSVIFTILECELLEILSLIQSTSGVIYPNSALEDLNVIVD